MHYLYIAATAVFIDNTALILLAVFKIPFGRGAGHEKRRGEHGEPLGIAPLAVRMWMTLRNVTLARVFCCQIWSF